MSNKYITAPYALLADLEPIDLSKIDLSKVQLPKTLEEIDVRRLPLQDRVPVVCYHQNYGGAQIWQVFPHHWVDELGICKAEWKDILDAMDLLDPEARRVPFPANNVEEARELYAKVIDFDNPNNKAFIERHKLVRPADDAAADIDIDAATQRGLEDAAKAREAKAG